MKRRGLRDFPRNPTEKQKHLLLMWEFLRYYEGVRIGVGFASNERVCAWIHCREVNKKFKITESFHFL